MSSSISVDFFVKKSHVELHGSLMPRSLASLRWACSAKPNRCLVLPKTSLHPVVAAESCLKMELLLLLERCFLLRFLGRYTLAQEVPGHPSTKFHKGISLMTAALMLAKRVSANLCQQKAF